MKKIKVADFPSRKHLEIHIGTLKNTKGVLLVGTKKEMADMRLSSATTIHGVSCVVTDEKVAKPKKFEKPDRGPLFESGINLPDNKRRKLKRINKNKK